MSSETATMNAVRFYGQRDIRLDKVPALPSGVKPGWVKLAPKFCGICGTDLHEFLGGANLIPTPGHPHPLTGETLPLTIGHEFSGVVEEVGEGVTHVKAGDKVCVQPTLWDDSCRSCKRGMVNCCDSNGFLGLSGWGGGMQETTLAPASAVKLLPDNISLEVGALVEPLAVGWHAVDISPFQEGDSALVLGGGPIGLSVIQALVSRGCKNIIVSEVATRRREFATQFGAHHVIDPTSEDVVEKVESLTGGLGADVGYDCAGVQVAVDSALKAIKARGTLVNVAVWEKKASLNMNDMVFRERAYMGGEWKKRSALCDSCAVAAIADTLTLLLLVATYYLGDFEAVIEAISSGRMKPEGMITKKVAMDKVADEGFKTLIEDKDNHVKILVDLTQPVA